MTAKQIPWTCPWFRGWDWENKHIDMSLTPWRLGSFGDFRKKNSSFRLPYQRPCSSADCARRLFNGSNGLANLVDCTQKKFFAWGVWVFCE